MIPSTPTGFCARFCTRCATACRSTRLRSWRPSYRSSSVECPSEGWDPSGTPERDREIDSFLRRITGEALLAGETEASLAAAAASRVLSRHISTGETESVLHMLPEHLRELLTPNRG
jgi:hypothetical protein